MKLFIKFLITSLLFVSCAKQSEVSKDFNCENISFSNLEKVNDFRNKFEIEIPKSWKTNLYYDKIQSSIYTADTTEQLTETVLLDVSYINDKINFNEDFILKQEQNHLSKNLIKTVSKNITFDDKPSFYAIYKGKKGRFLYQTCDFFIKINEEKFIHCKVEVYGDSLVNNRMCKAFILIEKIKIHQ